MQLEELQLKLWVTLLIVVEIIHPCDREVYTKKNTSTSKTPLATRREEEEGKRGGRGRGGGGRRETKGEYEN
jgi:hypothetical protein